MNKIYIIKCLTKDENFIKLGYTSKSIKSRFKNFKYKYKVLRVVRHHKSKTIERSIHRLMIRQRFKFSESFDGYTECYAESCFDDINTLIDSFCGVKTKPKKIKKTKLILNNVGKIDYMDISIYRS